MTAVTVCDVAPRDGLQNDSAVLDPVTRAELVNRLARAGVPRIEAVSFVHPGRVPQMAGAEEVVAGIERLEGVTYAGLALNERGYERLRETTLDEVHFAFAVSDEFNRRNAGTGTEDSVAAGERIVARAHEDDLRATVTLGTSFGCPFEGAVDPARVQALAARFVDAGADEIVFADTVGVAVPRQVRAIVAEGIRLGAAHRGAPAQHAQHRHRQRHGGAGRGRDGARRLRGRGRRLPVRATRDREHLHRGPRVPPPRRGHRDGHRSRRADRGRAVA